jgi:hypothetical protein
MVNEEFGQVLVMRQSEGPALTATSNWCAIPSLLASGRVDLSGHLPLFRIHVTLIAFFCAN